ncbi:MAG: hypothetical protein KAT20_00755 [Desulfuromonadales bacterium]|nr:hypothetical protein [Desulfuromonadales bacterium]
MDSLRIEAVLFTLAHFIATKLEAFFGRGNGNYWGSHDLEDIMTVIDGRPDSNDNRKLTTQKA